MASESGDGLIMSLRERDRLKVLSLVLSGDRSQVEAARLLKLSDRQVRRIVRRLEREQDAGVIHRLRGKRSNHGKDEAFRQQVLSLYREHYPDYGITHALEKLAGRGLHLGRETLRQWLLKEGLWLKQRKRDKHRRRRERRSCFGEMVQVDSSIHDWLEDRGPRCALSLMIDDATSRIMARFYPGETVLGYMDLARRYLQTYGRPVSWYTDRIGIFRIQPAERDTEEDRCPEFSRVFDELDIRPILACSPQAKGRVERAFGTLQDRWVKELREAGCRTIEQANVLLEKKLLRQFNDRWSVRPANMTDAHRPVLASQDLESILSIQNQRLVGNDYTFRFESKVYQLPPPPLPGLRKGKVTIEQRLGGEMRVRFKGAYLKFEPVQEAKKEEDGGVVEFIASAGSGLQGQDREAGAPRSSAVRQTDGRSGCTPAEPYPSTGDATIPPTPPRRPPKPPAWNKSWSTPKPSKPDILNGQK